MKEYTINTISVMGEEHPTYGYTYWAHTHESDYPVMFNSKEVLDDIRHKGRKLFAEEQELKESKNGKEYLRLKKVKLDEPNSSTITSSEQEPKPPQISEPKFLKDVTDLPARFIQSLLPYYDVQRLEPDTEQYFALMKLAKALAKDAAQMIEEMRNPEES